MTGVEMIAAERATHESHGYTAEHDDNHDNGEIAAFAMCLLAVNNLYGRDEQSLWPEGREYPERARNNRIVELTIAGALIAAEIDRLHRAAELASMLRIRESITPKRK